MNSYIKYLVATFLACIIPTTVLGTDGDLFTSTSTEGVVVKYKVISETDKTCQVGSGNAYEPAISTTYSGAVTIPSTVNGYSVISIGDFAFYPGCYLSSISIPNTVTRIGESAFHDCYKLTSVTLSEQLLYLDNKAFYNCSSLKSIVLKNSLKTIGERVFYNCSGITSITIPNTVTAIGIEAFSGCSGLTSVHISDIAAWCNIIFGNNPLWYAHHLYMNSEEVKDLVIPNGVTSISESAFRYCSGLTSVTIPNSVTSIGDKAFSDCTSLQLVASEIETPFAIDNTVFLLESGVHSTLQVPHGTKSQYQEFPGWIKYLAQVIETKANYTLSLTAIGNGLATYDGTAVKGKTSTFIIVEGTNATITFSPDNGYRIKSVKVNNTDVTSSVSNNSYTISNISSDITVEVEFEAIPPTTYTLSIKATGNGSATYDGTAVKGKTSTFTVVEGTNATITFSPDNGYRIKSVKVNNTDVTSSVSNNSYTISNISSDTTVEVEFEAIPPTTYTLSIKVTGNGSATYDGTTVRSKTSSFTVVEGTNATITFSPDNGYRIKSFKVNNADVTSSVSNNSYTISSISGDTTVEVEFEAIPPTTYTLSIKATGNGSASYDGTTIREKTSTFNVNEGSSATITFSSDNGYRIKSVKVNNLDVTSSVSNSSYTVSNISRNTTVEVEFEAIPITTYTLTIKATANGSATYDGTAVRSKTSSFTVVEGTNATITFSPDNGYRIKSVKVNNTDVTSIISNNSYTISNISGDTTVEVEFEAIPPTTYTLSITATGNGSATYDGTAVKGKTSTFTVNDGTNVTITFSPDNGYRIKSLKVGNSDVTSSVSNNSYSFKISSDTSVEVEFEAIPPTTYTLSITATGNGSATYDGTAVKGKTSTFTVNDGTNVTITFSPDNGYRIKSLKVGNSDVTSSVSNNSYSFKISKDTSVEVEFEAIPPTTYTLSITASGNGSATYDGTAVKGKTSTFTVNDGTNVTITFSPDNGYRIKSLKVGNSDVTSSISNNSYSFKISKDISVEVEFEAIPPTTYTLSITASGNGSATYDGTAVKGKTSTFTVNDGTNVTITFSPDNGYRIKSVKVNNSDVTSSVSNNTYIINNISRNTTVEVEFEVISSTTYVLSITATGNGSASYEGTAIKNQTNTFTVNEGANAAITFTPDNGYRIKSVKANSADVTSSVSNNTYTVTNISGSVTVEVEFEVIPATAYTLSIQATGNGSVTFDGTSVRGKTSSFNVNGGTSASVTFSADDGNRIKSVTVNSTDVTSKVMNNSYTIINISGNTTVEVVFEEIIAELTIDGVYFKVESDAQRTVVVADGNYGISLEVPASFTAKDKEWKVVGVEAGVLDNPELAAIIWNPEVTFSGNVSNPNLLLYVKDKKYAPDDIKNVIVNGEAEDIELTDAEDGNNFYCPQTFTAKRISYIHRYSMKTGFKTCQGWETIVLPFDVATILSATGTEIVPYAAWQQSSSSRPFWLYSMNENGWKPESGIKANTPYIISMPNNEEYDATYILSGDIQFMGSNVQVMASNDLSASKCGNKLLVPNYQNKVASQDIYALNVNSQWNTNTATETEGSAFIRSLRQARPFEAYMAIEGGAGARRAIPIFDDDSTGIPSIPVSIDRRNDAIYNLNGQRVNTMSRGIYIQNGKKIIKK